MSARASSRCRSRRPALLAVLAGVIGLAHWTSSSRRLARALVAHRRMIPTALLGVLRLPRRAPQWAALSVTAYGVVVTLARG